MIVKIYRKRGKNKRSRGRRGLTLARIVLCHNKNFRGSRPKRERNGKNRARTRRHHCFVLVGIMHYKGDTKQRCAILTLVFLYTERETHPLCLLKGDMLLVTHVSL
jgi:hypothetical protein